MIGQTISHYKILEELGSGGMGVVYKAHDLKLDRAVALKFLPHHLGHSDTQRERFAREARAASALDHPNVCTIYEIDETEDGRTFIAMGFCGGESLDKVIGRGVVPLDTVIGVATQVASGLASAHETGIIHRDIKPANIMVNAEGSVKIVDFGLAKLTRQTILTAEGTTIGTVAYMSPEQAQGGEVDLRTDIWSLGVVLYEMIAGMLPFSADHDAAVLYKIVNEEPEPIGSCRGETPQGLATIIHRALAKNPARRYESMNEMSSALQSSLSQTAIVAMPTQEESAQLDRARAAFARYDWPEAFAAFAEAHEHGKLAPEDMEQWADVATWMDRVDVCINANEDAHAQYVKDDRHVDAARTAIKLGETNFGKGARSVCNGWIKRAEKLLEKVPETVESGYLARLRARIAIEADQDLAAAADHAAKALEVAEKFHDTDLGALAMQDRGRTLVLQNRVDEGMALLDESMATAISGELSPNVVGVTYCNMISMCDKIADYRRAGEWSDQAVRWCQSHKESGFQGICNVRRADIMRIRGDWNAAEEEAERVSRRKEGFVAFVAGEAHYVMGEVRLRRGEYQEAELSFQEAHGRGRHPVPGIALLRLAQGRQDAASSLIDRALSDVILDLDRVRLLPAGVEIALATGDVATAQSRADELASLAGRFESNVFFAHAAHAAGALALTKSDSEGALSSLSSACRYWQMADMPYEEARARLLTATAYWKTGDNDLAELEARAARAIFERLGAAADVARADALLSEHC
ncbi:MAG: protein kinase [Candidatus Latescibacterota bacterium]|nr:MAG: protein kinase [Candidatus Latescibacterota bacterium]